MNRREFATLLSGAGLAALSPSLSWATMQQTAAPKLSRSIMLRSIHTGESGAFNYMIDGQLVRPELERLFHLLRDHRSGDVHPIDSKLLEQLYRLQQAHGKDTPFEVISGYRSAKTNAMLGAKSGGVAKKSFHMQGRAIDINMPGVALSELHRSATAMQAGGVGKYTRSGFIHIDTGHVRSWGA